MKKFQEPEITVQDFVVEDIITTSGGISAGGDVGSGGGIGW